MLGRTFDIVRTFSFGKIYHNGTTYDYKLYKNGAIEILLVGGKKPTLFQRRYYPNYSKDPLALSIRAGNGAGAPHKTVIPARRPAMPRYGKKGMQAGGDVAASSTTDVPAPATAELPAPVPSPGPPLWLYAAGGVAAVGIAYVLTRKNKAA